MPRSSNKVSVDQGLLIRVDERVASLQKKLDDTLDSINRQFTDVDKTISAMEAKFVTKDEIRPLKQFIYGFIGLIIIVVGTAVLGEVIK